MGAVAVKASKKLYSNQRWEERTPWPEGKELGELLHEESRSIVSYDPIDFSARGLGLLCHEYVPEGAKLVLSSEGQSIELEVVYSLLDVQANVTPTESPRYRTGLMARCDGIREFLVATSLKE